jgi:hypothetical protein
MDPELVEAYLRTEYRVDDPPQAFVLRVNEASAPLRACHDAFGVECSAFITAWNPRSQAVPLHENEAAMARLRQRLAAMELRCLRGEGVDPAGDWPGEPSLLVLGLDRGAAVSLGAQFEQNAVVCAGADGIPRLVLCV